MEREIERVREREPEPRDFQYSIEERYIRLRKERKYKLTLPHVIRFQEEPWHGGIHTWAGKAYIGGEPKDRLARVSICTMAINEQIVPAGGCNGRHRHVREAIFYVVEGRGHEVHDDQRYDWEAGDIFTVPTYCDHQHFNDDTKRTARLWFSISPVVDFMGVHWTQQIEMGMGEYRLPPGAQAILNDQGQIIGWRRNEDEYRIGADVTMKHLVESRQSIPFHIDTPRDNYEKGMKLLEEEVAWRQRVPHVVKGKEVAWEDTRMGHIKFMVTSETDCGLKTYNAYIQEIPPAGRSGRHRHLAEEVFKVLEGRGYDIHDGARWDWEAEDVVCIPPWTEHQHFNADSSRPARFVAFQTRWFAFMGHGGIQHLEDAPSWSGT